MPLRVSESFLSFLVVTASLHPSRLTTTPSVPLRVSTAPVFQSISSSILRPLFAGSSASAITYGEAAAPIFNELIFTFFLFATLSGRAGSTPVSFTRSKSASRTYASVSLGMSAAFFFLILASRVFANSALMVRVATVPSSVILQAVPRGMTSSSPVAVRRTCISASPSCGMII